MANTNSDLRKEYEVALENFIRQAHSIMGRVENDPLLKAQVMLTIIKCDPAADDFSSLKETLLKIDSRDRKELVREYRNELIHLLVTISNIQKKSLKDLEKMSEALELLPELIKLS